MLREPTQAPSAGRAARLDGRFKPITEHSNEFVRYALIFPSFLAAYRALDGA
jgi:hypothetical protein